MIDKGEMHKWQKAHILHFYILETSAAESTRQVYWAVSQVANQMKYSLCREGERLINEVTKKALRSRMAAPES
jgi:hypothetical protein